MTRVVTTAFAASAKKSRVCLAIALLVNLVAVGVARSAPAYEIRGQVLDPQSNVIPSARITVVQQNSGRALPTVQADQSGRFLVSVPALGPYTIKVNASGFQDVAKSIAVNGAETSVILQLSGVAERKDSITVTADVMDATVLFPDPAQRVYVRQETLDANPGRPRQRPATE